MNDCAGIRTILFATLEGECTPEERRTVTAHLAACDACRRDLEAERALTALLSRRAIGRDGRRAPLRRLLALAAMVFVMMAIWPAQPKSYGSIVSTTLSPRLSWQDGSQDELRESNHVQIPAGATATIEIAGTGTVRAVGPAGFELDLAGNRWKVTLHRGQLAVSVLDGESVLVASSWGTKLLEAGEHLVTPTLLAAAGGRDVSEILNAGLGAFISREFREAKADLAAVADHPGADRDQRLQALFYLGAAHSNLADHAAVVATADRWLEEAGDDAAGRSSMRYWRAEALEALGSVDEARAEYRELLRLEPDGAYAPIIRARLEAEPPAPSRPVPSEPAAPRSEQVVWSFAVGAPSFGSAAAGDLDGDGRREIVFGTYFGDRKLYALHADDGTLAWQRDSESGPRDASVLIEDLDGDGDVEVISADSATGRLECFDATGAVVWTTRLPSGTDSPPAAADVDGDGRLELFVGTMRVSGADGRLVALDGASGEIRWSVAIPGHIQSEPGVCDLDGDGGLDLLVTTWNGDDRLRALRASDGKALWSFATGDWIYHGVSVFDFDGDERPEVVVADRRGTVWMLEGESGVEKWKARLEGEHEGSVFAPTTLVDAEGEGPPEIVVCGAGVHLLSAEGEVLWHRDFGGASIARGAVVGDVTGDGRPEIVFGAGTALMALDPRDGTQVVSVELGTGNAEEAIDHAPLILDADGDGRLDVFLVIGRGRYPDREKNFGRAVLVKTPGVLGEAGSEWLTFRGGPRRLGSAGPR